MKKLILISFIIFLMATIVLVAFVKDRLLPLSYTYALTGRMPASIISLDLASEKYLLLEEKTVENMRTDRVQMSDNSKWKQFKFSHFTLNLPIKHPLFSFNPYIKFRGQGHHPDIGISILNHQYEQRFQLAIQDPILYGLDPRRWAGEDFLQYDFIQHLMRLDQRSVEEDFAGLDLNTVPTTWNDFWYQLYILKLRQRIFPQGFMQASYMESKKGRINFIFQLPNEDKNFMRELAWINNGKEFYPIEFVTSLVNPEAQYLRDFYLLNLYPSTSYPQDAKIIYEDFRRLPWKQKSTALGMMYLFSAWTHISDDKDFFKEMILFLEQGRDNFFYLRPLYSYAQQAYGEDIMFKGERILSGEMELPQSAESEILVEQDLRSSEDKIKDSLRQALEDHQGRQKESKHLLIP